MIRADTVALRDKYGEERRTQIVQGELNRATMEELIVEENNAVTISHNGYIKRLPLNTYRTQHRGGKGVSGGAAREDDWIEHFFVSSTHAYLLCFTNRGQMYWLKVYEIPQMGRTSPGRAIANVLSLKEDEKITSVIPVRRFDATSFLLMATRNGLIKKTALEEYSRPKAGGIIGINLEEGDTLIDVVHIQEADEIVLSTQRGMAIRFAARDARAMGRNTKGVKGISLMEGDAVIGMVIADPDGALLTVCENGYGKRTPFGPNTANGAEAADEAAEEETVEETPSEAGEAGEAQAPASAMRYRKQRRGGKGLRDIRTSDRNGPVIGVASVRDDEDIMLITTQGMVNRTHINEIRMVGRNTQGVHIMQTSMTRIKISSIMKIAKEDVQEDEGAEGTPETPEAGTAE